MLGDNIASKNSISVEVAMNKQPHNFMNWKRWMSIFWHLVWYVLDFYKAKQQYFSEIFLQYFWRGRRPSLGIPPSNRLLSSLDLFLMPPPSVNVTSAMSMSFTLCIKTKIDQILRSWNAPDTSVSLQLLLLSCCKNLGDFVWISCANTSPVSTSCGMVGSWHRFKTLREVV